MNRGDCPRCGQNVPHTERGSIKAHRCKHGTRCDPMPGRHDVPICGPCLDAKNQRAIESIALVRDGFNALITGRGSR